MSSGVPDPLNLVLAGVGGQGVLLASRLICDAVVKIGLQVQALEEHGMAQRGGAVTTQLRFGRYEIFTSEIRPGAGHVLLAFEPMEALRALHLLGPEATLIINSRQLPPQPLPAPGSDARRTRNPRRTRTTALDMAEANQLIRERFERVRLFDATTLAEQAGSSLAVNMVLLGAVVALGLLPPELDREALKTAIDQGAAARFLMVNQRAFEAGYEAI